VNVRVADFEVEDEDVHQSRIRLVPFDEIELGTERRYLVKGLVPRTGLIVVWGPPKSGKSFKVLDLVMHVALSRPYRDRRVHPGTVVYCAFEGQTGIETRCAAFRKKFLADHHELVPFYLEPVTLDLVNDAPELIRVIRRSLGDVKPAVIVLDTLNRSLRGSESSDVDMSAYVRATDSLREAFDCAVIVVHHCGIDGTRPRGHTSLTGAADAQLSVSRDAAGSIVMTVEYMKDGTTGDTIVSRLENVEVGTDDDGEPITSCVVVPSETCGKAAVQLKGAARIALEALYEVIAEEGEVVENSRIPPNTRTTTVVRWEEYFEAQKVSDATKPDSKRRAFVRASEKLQDLRIIGIWKDRVWVAGQTGQVRT
jgi:AAA domain